MKRKTHYNGETIETDKETREEVIQELWKPTTTKRNEKKKKNQKE